MDKVADLQDRWSKAGQLERIGFVTAGVAGTAVTIQLARYFVGTRKGAPSSFGLSGGSYKGEDAGKEFAKYMSSYGEVDEEGRAIVVRPVRRQLQGRGRRQGVRQVHELVRGGQRGDHCQGRDARPG